MGAGFSSQNGVAIRTIKTAFVPGDIVEGSVALNCVDAIELSGLKLEVWFYSMFLFGQTLHSVCYYCNSVQAVYTTSVT